jgi:hypothetical protein
MPFRKAPQTGYGYYLIELNANGVEQAEDGVLLSAQAVTQVREKSPTDVFVASHGWMADINDAESQYGTWIDTMVMQGSNGGDFARELVREPAYKSAAIGVHWPSLPFGDEQATTADPLAADPFAEEAKQASALLVDRYAARIAGSDAARAALAAILAAADRIAQTGNVKDLAAGNLPSGLADAYQALFQESGLGAGGGPVTEPGLERGTFDPGQAIREWIPEMAAHSAQLQPPRPLRLLTPIIDEVEKLVDRLVSSLESDATKVRDLALAPVRLLSFWAMKDRARTIGLGTVHDLLVAVQDAAPGARVHLMGHSFGAIVVSAAISGRVDGSGAIASRLPRPVSSVFLAQGAMSLWSYAGLIPLPSFAGEVGAYQPIEVPPELIAGPLVTTRSAYDTANGSFFPLAARLGSPDIMAEARRRVLAIANGLAPASTTYPDYGAVGTYGLQGTQPMAACDLTVYPATAGVPAPEYGLQPGTCYNADASMVIRRGPWPEGAHSDISHPEIAHLFWSAVQAGAYGNMPGITRPLS